MAAKRDGTLALGVAAGVAVCCGAAYAITRRPAQARGPSVWEQLKFAWKVRSARLSDVPEWVNGPRPSNQCLAFHDYSPDASEEMSRSVEQTVAEVRRGLKHRRHELPGERLYGLPAAFRPQAISARGVHCTWASYPGIGSDRPVLLFLHGGSGYTGTPALNHCARLSCALGVRVLSVAYRLAPEHAWPAAVEDCVGAYRWLTEDAGISPQRVALWGCEAGGSLLVLTLQELQRQGLPLPSCGVTSSAWIPKPAQAHLWEMVIGNRTLDGEETGLNSHPKDDRLAFIHGSFANLPPLYVLAGREEAALDVAASVSLAETARDAGVTVKLDLAPHMQHCPDRCLFLVPEATACVNRAATFVRSHLKRGKKMAAKVTIACSF